jgi:hypothetical protein
MAIDEAMRHRIHDRLEALLGAEEAAALMAALPTDEVATKSDLEHLRELLTMEIARSSSDLASTLRAEMNSQFRFMLQWLTGTIIAVGSLGIAAGHLL